MPRYRIEEGSFVIGLRWQDNSVNIFSVGTSKPPQISIVLVRERLNPDEELVQFAERQMNQLAGTLKRFRVLEQRQIVVSGALALEAEFLWASADGSVNQRQVYIPCHDKILILTATAKERLSDAQNVEIDELLASFDLSGSD